MGVPFVFSCAGRRRDASGPSTRISLRSRELGAGGFEAEDPDR